MINLGFISGYYFGYGGNGLICGKIYGGFVDQVYVKKEVFLINNNELSFEMGGLFGSVSPLNPPYKLTINNSYCLATLNSSFSETGGFIGNVLLENQFNLQILNSYSKSSFRRNSGNFIGLVSGLNGTIEFVNTYFNDDNGFPSISDDQTCCSQIIQNAIGKNSSTLNNTILDSFSFPMWCGLCLCNGMIKHNFNFKKL